ncbi:MAG: HlyD family efflux transporter periplasmic adaptor subunit [Labilithrix sp.]|nr:HlyD family efflux transporter periplasmic adaptor subunit [Labilithrix sp.]MCW5814844.1 HlyD family efflux transporter periplasmic adaptor subunit [Labilithrix sp.]
MDLPRTPPPPRRWPLLVIALVLCLGVAAAACARRPSLGVDRATVWTERVRRGTFVRQVPVQGRLVSEDVRWLSAATAARVARIEARPGSEVNAGDVVVVLENADVELAALEAERAATSAEAHLIELEVRSRAGATELAGNLALLRAEVRAAARRADDATRLAAAGLAAENERRDLTERVAPLGERVATEEARHAILVAGGARELAAHRADVARLRDIAAFRRRQVEGLVVRATTRGVVQELPLETGQWAAVGAVLARIAEPGALKAELKVAEGWARDVTSGLEVTFAPIAGAEARARLTRVEPAVLGGAVRLEARFTSPPSAGARPDQTVTGWIEIERTDDALSVARPAGVLEGAPARVYRVTPEGAALVDVLFGRGSAREIQVLGGLAAGDEIVVSATSQWEGAAGVRWR